MSKKIIFGLGSNLGDKKSYLEKAVLELEKALEMTDLKQSEIFKNPAMLLPNSPSSWNSEFFNIALSGRINLEKFTPDKILFFAKKIEKDLGRQEREKWAPREIDIDILLIENVKINSENLVIPHPGIFERDFFLKTVTEIEPQWNNLLPK